MLNQPPRLVSKKNYRIRQADIPSQLYTDSVFSFIQLAFGSFLRSLQPNGLVLVGAYLQMLLHGEWLHGFREGGFRWSKHLFFKVRSTVILTSTVPYITKQSSVGSSIQSRRSISDQSFPVLNPMPRLPRLRFLSSASQLLPNLSAGRKAEPPW